MHWTRYLNTPNGYIQPRAQRSASSTSASRPSPANGRCIGGLFEEVTVERLPWRDQQRRVRTVVYRRASLRHSTQSNRNPDHRAARTARFGESGKTMDPRTRRTRAIRPETCRAKRRSIRKIAYANALNDPDADPAETHSTRRPHARYDA
ncbi:hypothetical protein DIE15_29650 [Burkholderia sp. Bp9031]|nr:hypothetical protein DIE15_29650 [Burkholderia sp. Bp9031]